MERHEKKKLVDFIVTARKYKTTLTHKYENRKQYVPFVEGEIRAFLPGTIINVCVQPGEEVKEGQLLVIHEAMKMQNRMVSPINGKVTQVFVKQGDKIPKDFILVEVK